MADIKLTQNFNISEFACNDGTNVPYDLVDNVRILALNLQVLRDYLQRPILITSGFRNATYNRQIGGEPNSYHIKAMAADIQVTGTTPDKLYQLIENLITAKKMKQGGLGLYKNFVHYDTRGKKARW